MIDWKTLPRPIIALAPMADMTDLPFCLVCKDQGAPLMFREMVSSEAVVRLNEKTLAMARLDDRERPVIQQIFGADPSVMAEAARIIEERFRPDGIDINMGCPVYNIVTHFNGASLMKDPERAAAMIRAVKNAVSVPVSVKTRLGWSRPDEIRAFVQVIEQAGADLISIHGRTKEEGYAGHADWDAVGAARTQTSLPVLVNGDVTSLETAREALTRSGADGVLIGRAALGNPWIFRELALGLRGEAMEPLSLEERIASILVHAERHVEHYGERGIITLRKHLPWYFKKELRSLYPWIDFTTLRARLVRVQSLDELKEILAQLTETSMVAEPSKTAI